MLMKAREDSVRRAYLQWGVHGVHSAGARYGGDSPVLPTTFDALVGILVQRREVFPELFVFS